MRRDLRGLLPLLRIVFYLELLWAIFPLNPAKSARITFFESANIGTFVRAESAFIETGFKTRFRADSGRFERGKSDGSNLLMRVWLLEAFWLIGAERIRDSGLVLNDFVGESEASTGNTSDMCELEDGFLALKLDEDLTKLVGIILAAAVALTGQIVDRLRRQPVVVRKAATPTV